MTTKKKASVITAPDIVVEVGSKKYTLVVGLQAVRTICGTLGGVAKAYEGVAQHNPDVKAIVIIAGSGLTFDEKFTQDDFVEQIWRLNNSKMNAMLIQYLSILLNGGRPLSEEPSDGEGQSDEGK